MSTDNPCNSKDLAVCENTLNVSFVSYKQVHHHEFIPMFEKQYPDHRWADVEVSMERLLNV